MYSLSTVALVLLFIVILFDTTIVINVDALSSLTTYNKGCAGRPYDKKKIIVFGTGGYLGSITFGFLQRCSSLYGTGIGSVRSIGATADTAIRMNRILSKQFCLAYADESYIKLTNIYDDIESIQNRINDYDAIIFGTNIQINQRSVTGNTYERTPNDKTYEVYWDDPKGSFVELPDSISREIKDTILLNLLAAIKQSKNIKHMILVDDGTFIQPGMLEGTGVPYTRIRVPTSTSLSDTPDYTFKEGIRGNLLISSSSGNNDDLTTTTTICREDLAALCVQCLQSLSWDVSRTISVSCDGPVQLIKDKNIIVKKRDDQQWCVNSYILEDKLATIN